MIDKYLRDALAPLAKTQGQVILGYSGGLDSSVLLQAVAELTWLKPRIKALHIHHGLSAQADYWLEHSQQQAQALGIAFYFEKVQLQDKSDGIEQAARMSRYQAYQKHSQAGDYIILAHHADDQIETFFMRATRGAGGTGLTGIPESRVLPNGAKILRPLLPFTRAELEAYAKAKQLSWIEDESNADSSFERNWWRNQLLPVIWNKFPQRKRTLLRTISQLKQDQKLIQELLEPRFRELCTPWNWPNCAPIACDLATLTIATETQQPYLLRMWLKKLGLINSSQQWLAQLNKDLIQAAVDAMPVMYIGDWSVSRHKEYLYLFLAQNLPKDDIINIQYVVQMPWAGAWVKVAPAQTGLATGKYQVVPAQNVFGENLKMLKRPNKSIKTLLHEADVPAQLRANWPVIMDNHKVCAIVGISVAEDYLAKQGEPAWQLDWKNT
ncbi:MAG: tRNA lysidine(34) synthetase TilS [Venatoribacter sp.]